MKVKNIFKEKKSISSCFLPWWMALAKAIWLLIGANLCGLSMEFAGFLAAASARKGPMLSNLDIKVRYAEWYYGS